MKKRHLILVRRSNVLVSAAALAVAATADVSRAQLATITFSGTGNSLNSSSNYSPSATPNMSDLADVAAVKLASGGTTGYMSVAGTSGSSVTLGALAFDLAAPGGLVILDSTSSSSNAVASTLNLDGGNQGTTLSNTGDTVPSGDLITINPIFNGTLDIRGYYNGNYPASQSSVTPTGVGATIALGSTSGNIDIANNSTLEFGQYGSLTGSANVNITGGGTLEVYTITPSGVGSPYGSIALGLPGFTGGFTVTGGSTLAIYNTSSLSFGSNDTTTLNNGIIYFHSNAGLGTGHPILLAGVGGTINVTSGTESIGGLISGGTSGTTLTKAGAGVLNINFFQNALGTNTFSGSVAVNAGTLLISNSTDLGNATTLNLNGGAFTYDGTIHTGTSSTTTYVSTTTSSSLGVVLSASTNTISVGYPSTGNLATLTIPGSVSGTGGLTKTDVGALTLTNSANSYSGGTTINGGALYVSGGASGSETGTGSVNINTATATFGGIGAASGAVNAAAGATLAPGTSGSYGSLSTGAVSLVDTAKLSVSLDSDTGSVSLLNVSGTVALGNSAGALLSVTDAGVNTSDALGTVYTVVSATGAVTGSFSNLQPGNLIVASNSWEYLVTVNDPNGANGVDNVTLTLEATPEPATTSLIAISAGGMLLRRRRNPLKSANPQHTASV